MSNHAIDELGLRHTVDSDGIMVAKGTAMGVLFLASMTTGTLPFLLAHFLNWNTANPSRRASRAISMSLSFGGGVLLATTFLHLLPEVRETIEELQHDGELPATSFPLAELLMCVGFFVIYAVSEVVHGYIRRHNKAVQLKIECALQRCPNGTVPSAPAASTAVSTANLVADGEHAHRHAKDVEAGGQHKQNGDRYEADQHHQNAASLHHHSHLHLPDSRCLDDDALASALRGLLIVLALSVHELFEGMALGLESSTGDVWLFFGAIASHKLVLAFCVGIELLVAKTNRWLAVGYIVMFAVVSPIGIGIGMLVSQSTGSLITGVVLQAMATGTLVYVVYFEILKKGGAGLLQLLAVLIGFAVMFGLHQIGKCGYMMR